jgi:hypothetical protein
VPSARHRAEQGDHGRGGDDGPRAGQREPAATARGRGRRCCRRGAGGRALKLGVLLQDRPLELAQLLAGLQSEVLDQFAARPAVGLERIRLAPGPVEGEHQQRPQSLAERVADQQALQLRDRRGIVAELELGLEGILECGLMALVEVRALGAGEGFVDIGERRPAPDGECLAQERRSRRGIPGRPCLGRQLLEPGEVELFVCDLEDVAGAACADSRARARFGERLAQARDRRLHRVGAARGRVVAPQRVDDLVARDDPVAPQQQQRQEGALARTSDRLPVPSDNELDGAEHPEADGRPHDERRYHREAGLTGRCEPAVSRL